MFSLMANNLRVLAWNYGKTLWCYVRYVYIWDSSGFVSSELQNPPPYPTTSTNHASVSLKVFFWIFHVKEKPALEFNPFWLVGHDSFTLESFTFHLWLHSLCHLLALLDKSIDDLMCVFFLPFYPCQSLSNPHPHLEMIKLESNNIFFFF